MYAKPVAKPGFGIHGVSHCYSFSKYARTNLLVRLLLIQILDEDLILEVFGRFAHQFSIKVAQVHSSIHLPILLPSLVVLINEKFLHNLLETVLKPN